MIVDLTSPAYLRGIETPIFSAVPGMAARSPAYLRGIETPAKFLFRPARSRLQPT